MSNSLYDLDPQAVYTRENDTKSFIYVDTRTTSIRSYDLVLRANDGEIVTVRLFDTDPERYISLGDEKNFFLRVEI